MRTVNAAGESTLVWKSVGSTYELRAGDEVLARLTFPAKTSFGLSHAASASDATGSWTFEGSDSHITARREADATIAMFDKHRQGKGTLTLSGRGTYQWDYANDEKTQGRLSSEGGDVLLTITSQGGAFSNLDGIVRLQPAAFEEPELGLLISFGWYLLYFRWMEQSVVPIGETRAVAAREMYPAINAPVRGVPARLRRRPGRRPPSASTGAHSRRRARVRTVRARSRRYPRC